MFKLFLMGMMFFLMMPSYAQVKQDEIPAKLILALQENKPDSIRLQFLIQLSHYYYFEVGNNRANLDSAFIFLQKAWDLSEAIHATKWKHEILCFTGKYYFKIGKFKKANEYFINIENDIKKSGRIEQQVVQWESLAWKIRGLDTFGLTKINCFEKIVQLSQQSNNIERKLEAEKDIADVHIYQGKLDLAQRELEEVLARYKAIGFQKLHHTYILLSATSNYKGNYNTAIHYALLALESVQKTKDTAMVLNIHVRLAYFYHELGQTEKSIEYFRLVFAGKFKNPIHFYLFRDAHFFIRDLISQKKEKEALAFILGFSKKHPPSEPYGKASLARTLAYCYNALQNYPQGEKYAREMIFLSPSMGKNNEIRGEVEYDIGKYYLEKKQFQKAADHFKISLYEAYIVSSLTKIKDIHLMLFKVDSSTGNYLSAIKHLNQYRQLNDSIFNETKSRQIEEVKVAYETEKKEKDITLLEKESKLQHGRLLQAGYTRNWILGGVALLLIIMGLLAYNIRLKQRTNKKLAGQQTEIGEQNVSLRHLVNEKEWLVKEIHHRVKNNFQTVMGLLGTQSGYLKNKIAINAIADSQHRIHAMSLIHQKLYQTENLTTINMPDYIHELVDYLRDSFNTSDNIRFSLQIEPIELDLAHCIPLGLILNESIINSFKYAFPGNREGNIFISLKDTSGNHLSLIIKDDGVGLPPGFDAMKIDSMGMNLMKGLSKELEAKFTLSNESGTEININFFYEPDDAAGIAQKISQPAHSI